MFSGVTRETCLHSEGIKDFARDSLRWPPGRIVIGRPEPHGYLQHPAVAVQ